MTKASTALHHILTTYSITPTQLTTALQIPTATFTAWLQGHLTPPADRLAALISTLHHLNPQAAEDVIQLYLEEANPPIFSPTPLPPSDSLNIPALARLFNDTTNSYKYLFFLSLLDILRRHHFQPTSPIAFFDLIVEMLANAWFPHSYFKLSFGSQDKIAQQLDALALVVEAPVVQFKDPDKTLLRQAIARQDLKDTITHLRRYVPFRLIIPFLAADLGAVSRGRGNQLDVAMPAIADRHFDSRRPLYRFDSTEYKTCQGIIPHPDWLHYLQQHDPIIRRWAAWEWLTYMQKRNPNTPAIASKLFMPSKRDSLKTQTNYWSQVLTHQTIPCIYSGQPIPPQGFSLDHYLPWSFVAHDQLWNLIPTLPEVNSAKSNKIPAPSHLAHFHRLQHQGLTITHATLPPAQWSKQVEPYLHHLGLANPHDLLNLERLRNAYDKTLPPLITLAANQGFLTDWRYGSQAG